ncbi:MAG: 30S ribosomal protein S21 [Candidatus Moranbacteria bacterium]|nr:30S ribosomal protein S21 [Candidatus Moranbacteria bacterium]
MVEVKNKGNEPVDNLLRRFSRRWQSSGIGKRDRKKKYYQKPATKRVRKLRALHRLKLLKEKKRLIKLGRLEDEKNKFMSGKIGKS